MPSTLFQRARAAATADAESEAEVKERTEDVDLLAPAETILALINTGRRGAEVRGGGQGADVPEIKAGEEGLLAF
jgi:hypothetical protein